MEILRENLKITREFRQMSDAQIAQLLARTAEAGRSGQYEWWKTPKGREWTRDHPECFS
jgi:hypothetical protein